MCLLSRIAGFVCLLFVLDGCAGDRNYRQLPPGEGPGIPHFIELIDEPSIATFHFPRGLYSLEAEDDRGYYYRAPRQLLKHSFAGSQPYDGGLFVRKGSRAGLRGWILWAGGRTKIGNLSRAQYAFRD